VTGRHWVRRALLIAASLLACVAQAQTDTASAEPPPADEAGLPPLSLTRLRSATADAATSTTVIEARTLHQFGIESLTQAMRLVSGASLLRIGGTDIRLDSGFDNFKLPVVRRVNLLIDGVTVYRAGNAQLLWPTIPVTIDDIDRLEVTRGPNAAGAGADPGVMTVNIITRHPSDAQRAQFTVATGSRGARNVTARTGWSLGSTALRLTANQYRSGDDDETGLSGITRDSLTSLTASRMTLRSETALDDRSTLGIDLAYLEAKRDALEATDDTPARPLARGRDGYASVLLRHSISPTHEIALAANYWVNTARALVPTLGRSRTSIELRDTFIGSERMRLESGIGARRQAWVSRDPEGAPGDAWAGYAFAGVVVRPWEWLTVNSGLRADDPEGRGLVVSPRTALSFHVGRGQALRLGWSSGVWAPDGQDPRPIVARTISRERVDSAEVGYVLNVPEWGLQLDARAYRNRISGQVVPPPKLASAGELLEVSGRYGGVDLRATADWSADWSTFIAMSTLRRSDADPDDERARRYLNAYCGGVSWHNGSGWNLALSLYGASGDAGAQRRTQRVDLTVGRSFTFASTAGRWVVVYSRFDNTAQEPTAGDDGAAASSYRDGLLYAKFEIGF
jgi:outer membrane cobalamin receptor